MSGDYPGDPAGDHITQVGQVVVGVLPVRTRARADRGEASCSAGHDIGCIAADLADALAHTVSYGVQIPG